MNKKVLKLGLYGRTNAGKSTLINKIIGEKISIVNKKVNTTIDSIIGVLNTKNVQLIFYDTPGSNFLKSKKNTINKKIKTEIWETLNHIDTILFLVDAYKFNLANLIDELKSINTSGKPIIVIFNKIDLLEKKLILPYVSQINDQINITDYFYISAKFSDGTNELLNFLISKSMNGNWIYKNNEITNKDDIFITNECTRNAILNYLHKEIPYNVKIKNINFKILKNQHTKIKQKIIINNKRYKSIILGKNGSTIKRIRERSQKEIQKILNCKTHLYIEISLNDK
tara:strand:+ start:391 stop:1242 length:852 start_codon:yes stop_codon:yes gene_type:complete